MMCGYVFLVSVFVELKMYFSQKFMATAGFASGMLNRSLS